MGKPARHFLATFVGSGPFPLDMLRRDECFPHTEEDAGRAAETGRRTVVVASATGVFSDARWASFGWTRTRTDGGAGG